MPTGIDDGMELIFRVLGCGDNGILCLKLGLLRNDAANVILRGIK